MGLLQGSCVLSRLGFDEVCEAPMSGEIHRHGVAEVGMSVEEGGHDPAIRSPGKGFYRGYDTVRDGDTHIFFPEFFTKECPTGDDV